MRGTPPCPLQRILSLLWNRSKEQWAPAAGLGSVRCPPGDGEEVDKEGSLAGPGSAAEGTVNTSHLWERRLSLIQNPTRLNYVSLSIWDESLVFPKNSQTMFILFFYHFDMLCGIWDCCRLLTVRQEVTCTCNVVSAVRQEVTCTCLLSGLQ